ncbi:MAG: hypothetical protein HY263_11775 [Chloroflexi bacterium]|nr:hypothetical protein [Chloroflexota bacterium]
MTTTGLVVAAVGVLLIAIGLARARAPWARYRALKSQEDNIARYESWRGGLRDTGPTGASVAIEMLRSQLRIDAAIAGVGVVAALVGLFIR